jgi:hypothetical protein
MILVGSIDWNKSQRRKAMKWGSIRRGDGVGTGCMFSIDGNTAMPTFYLMHMAGDDIGLKQKGWN